MTNPVLTPTVPSPVERRPVPPLAARAVWLLTAGLALLALALSGPTLVRGAADQIPDRLYALLTVMLGIYIEALPFLLVGVLASAALQAFVSPDLVRRWVPEGRLRAPLTGGLLGMLFPVCECGVVPVTRRLISKGAPLSSGVAFLLAGSVVNPVVLVSTWVAFGDPTMALARVGGVLAIAVLVGAVFSFHRQPERLLVEQPTAPSPGASPATHRNRLAGVALGASAEFFEMSRYLVLGAFLAAALQTFVPRPALMALGQDPVSSVAALMGLAVLLSICSVVDAFVALSFVSTFSSGAILAFLVFGPMVDIKSTLMFLGILKPRAVAAIILLTAQAALLLGLFVNLNVG